jgi:hypothetical protein
MLLKDKLTHYATASIKDDHCGLLVRWWGKPFKKVSITSSTAKEGIF